LIRLPLTTAQEEGRLIVDPAGGSL